MENQRLLILLTGALLLIAPACKEIGPVVNFEIPESTKVVLIDEFTGVRCINCPKGHRKLEGLQDSLPGKLAVLSIHAGFFATPYPESKEDYKIDAGVNIDLLLGKAGSWPSGAIDRKLFPNESDVIVGDSKWTGYILQQLGETPVVNLTINHNYVVETRKLQMSVDIQYVEEVTQQVRLSVALTEDSIIDLQLDIDFGKDPDSFYVHNNVLRDMLTPFDGVDIDTDIKLGTVFNYALPTYTLPDNIDPKHCNIIVFMTETGDAITALQAATAELMEEE